MLNKYVPGVVVKLIGTKIDKFDEEDESAIPDTDRACQDTSGKSATKVPTETSAGAAESPNGDQRSWKQPLQWTAVASHSKQGKDRDAP